MSAPAPNHLRQNGQSRPAGRRSVRGMGAMYSMRRAAFLPAWLAAQMLVPSSARANEATTGISINGARLPDFRAAAPASGFAGGAPGLPDAGGVIEREAPGTHGLPASPGPAAPDQMGSSEAETKAAQARCQRTLAGLDAHFTFISQVKTGSCGTPAPIELSGFGKGLAISPPVVVTCDIAAALHAWMKTQIQPLARRHLGSAIIQINTMSSYSCRNRYGARNAPLSQHAFANAIDVRGFVTASGQLLDVEQHWGPTAKELAAYQASLPAVQAGPIPSLPLVAKKPSPVTTGAIPAGAATAKDWSTTVANGPAIMPAAIDTASGPAIPALRPSFPAFTKAGAGDPSAIRIVASGQAAHSGPPPLLPGQALDGRAQFLREAWQGACGPFTTVLGPEANRAHRNHFHIDLAQRKSGAFCQ